jgi:hypothetical protein
MSLILLFSHLFAAYYLLGIIRHFNKPPLLTFLYCAIPAFVWSLHYSLPESIMGAF